MSYAVVRRDNEIWTPKTASSLGIIDYPKENKGRSKEKQKMIDVVILRTTRQRMGDIDTRRLRL
jgi:hypothetical protein